MIVDNRAGSKELVDKQPLMSLATLGTLEYGDVALAGNGPDGPVAIGVEVKSVTDLLNSARTQRLQGRQLRGMRATYDYSWLLVYGQWRPDARGGLEIWNEKQNRWVEPHGFGSKSGPYSYVERLLISVTNSNVAVKTIPSLRQCRYWLAELDAWWQKSWQEHTSMRELDQTHLPAVTGLGERQEVIAKVASCLPGMGFKRAMAAATHFPSVREMLNAAPEQWAEIPGIGLGIGRGIEEAVG